MLFKAITITVTLSQNTLLLEIIMFDSRTTLLMNLPLSFRLKKNNLSFRPNSIHLFSYHVIILIGTIRRILNSIVNFGYKFNEFFAEKDPFAHNRVCVLKTSKLINMNNDI